MRKFPIDMKYTYWCLILTVILLSFLQSCSKSIVSTKKLVLTSNEISKVGQNVSILVDPLEPGISKILLSIESSDTKIDQVMKSYPYKFVWRPDNPGIYTILARGYSVVDGKVYTDQKKVFVYDTLPPYIESIKVIPERAYENDELLLQIKVGSKNPVIDLTASGIIVNSTNTTNLKIKPGYNYLRLGKISSVGDIQLFVKTKAYDTEDATVLKLSVNSIDRISPEIVVSADTFYSPESNVVIRITLRDNIGLSKFKLTFDDENVLEKNIQGTYYTEEISLGKKDMGTHAINVVAYDKEGNQSTFAKRIYVGGTALRFKVQLSPDDLIAGRTAVIAMIPEEKDISYKKIIYLVDGRKIAEYPNENVNKPQLFTLWEIEEGEHYITVYAESTDGRAGIGETNISVRDYNGPRFVSFYGNEKELKLGEDNYLIPGLITFKLTVEDPGGVSLTTKPKLLIKEDESEGFYRSLDMDVFEVSGDLRRVTFALSTYISIGYYYVSFMNVADKSGNLMRDVGRFLVYVQ